MFGVCCLMLPFCPQHQTTNIKRQIGPEELVVDLMGGSITLVRLQPSSDERLWLRHRPPPPRSVSSCFRPSRGRQSICRCPAPAWPSACAPWCWTCWPCAWPGNATSCPPPVWNWPRSSSMGTSSPGSRFVNSSPPLPNAATPPSPPRRPGSKDSGPSTNIWT
jgi:hypothetical protein